VEERDEKVEKVIGDGCTKVTLIFFQESHGKIISLLKKGGEGSEGKDGEGKRGKNHKRLAHPGFRGTS